MATRFGRNRRQPGFENLEGKVLLSSGVSVSFIGMISRQSEIRAAREYSIIGVVGGVPSGVPGQTVTIKVGLAASSRTGIYHEVRGRINLSANGSTVGIASSNGTYVGSHGDVYGVATFSYRIPPQAAHGSSVLLQMSFAGDTSHGPAQGSVSMTVR